MTEAATGRPAAWLEAPRDENDNGAAKPSHVGLIIEEWGSAWRPGMAALIAGSISYSLFSAVSSLFVEPLQAQFGWSRGDIAIVHSFGLITAFAAPVVGRLTDRHGVRPVLL